MVYELEGNNIKSWEQMKQTFIEKYRDYCKAMDTRDEIFRMIQGENESLEDYERGSNLVTRGLIVSHWMTTPSNLCCLEE
jgi:hypothetical protein